MEQLFAALLGDASPAEVRQLLAGLRGTNAAHRLNKPFVLGLSPPHAAVLSCCLPGKKSTSSNQLDDSALRHIRSAELLLVLQGASRRRCSPMTIRTSSRLMRTLRRSTTQRCSPQSTHRCFHSHSITNRPASALSASLLPLFSRPPSPHLTAAGMDILRPDASGRTVLHYAAACRCAPVLLVVEPSLTPAIRFALDKSGRTAGDVALHARAIALRQVRHARALLPLGDHPLYPLLSASNWIIG